MKLVGPVKIALIRKDLLGLFPLVVLTVVVLTLDIVVSEFYRDSDSALLVFLAICLPWLSLLTGLLLVLSVTLQDPAVSLVHDWQTRPIGRLDLLLAKLIFLGLVIVAPTVVIGFLASLFSGHSPLESLLRATSVESWWVLLLTPFVFMVAFISRSLLNAFSNIIGALLLMMIPGAFLPPVPLNPDSVGDDQVTNGIFWILVYPGGVALLLLCLGVYWLQYSRKQAAWAIMASLAGLLVTVGLIAASVSMPLWPVLTAAQARVVNGARADAQERVIVEEVFGCFPAAGIGGDGEFALNAQSVLGAGEWSDFRLDRAGAGAVTFATNAAVGGLPKDWRAVMLHAKATYEAESISGPVVLKPGTYRNANPFGTSDNVTTHYWLLPEGELQQLKEDESTALTLDYTLALLSPHQQQLSTDNVRRYLSGIGYCSAQVDAAKNEVNVDCFKRGAQPALLAAELVHVPASRVDSVATNFSPAWIEFLGGRHYELVVQMPSLVDHSKILLTAYHMEQISTEQIHRPGVLGNTVARCSVPSSDDPALFARSSWSDSSPHEVSLVSVEPGVRLEVLDWGGAGKTVVLLAGAGATAHLYDDLAPKLAENHRVVGITRRGFGSSSRPNFGYDMDRLSQDILEVVEAMDLDSPVLIGHSLAGDELSTLGSKHPAAFSGLVYLDAAYDRSGTDADARQLTGPLPRAPSPFPSDMVSYDSARNFFGRLFPGNKPLPEGEMMATYTFLSTGDSRNSFDPRVGQALLSSIPPPDYANIPLPSLAIYALETSAQSYMRSWYDPDDPVIQDITEQLFALNNPKKRASIAGFDRELPESEVIILDDASHSIFLSNEAEVLAAINRFTATLD